VARFLIRRILQGLLVLWLMTVTVFLIFFVGPGPQYVPRILAGRQATPQAIRLITNRLWLNRPLWEQYKHFFWDGLIIHRTLGQDYFSGASVGTTIKQAFPITLSLVIGASLLWLAIGLLTGIISAVRTRSVMDRTFTTQALFFYSMPTFVLGLILIWFFYSILSTHGFTWFIAPNVQPPSLFTNPLGWAHVLLLPWLTIALVSAATYTRLTRGSMLDVFGEDYIRTARSKGMSERRVIIRHNLRAALTPIVTQFGLDVGTLIGGAIVTEQIFGLTGLGWEAIKAISNQDLPLIIGVVIIASAGVITANLLVDIGYAILDPRVRIH
jgi:peptide/nickel transport system permease protein